MIDIWPKDDRLLEWSDEVCKVNNNAFYMNHLVIKLQKLNIITKNHLLSDDISNWLIKLGKDKDV